MLIHGITSKREDAPIKIQPAILTLFYLLLLQYKPAGADTADYIQIASFSTMSVTDITPPGWQPLVFDSIEAKTAYFLTRAEDRTVVQAVSHGSASAYFKKLDLLPSVWPIIKWQWRISHVLNKGNVLSREGDDYPARIYISFAYDPNRLSGTDRLKYKLYSLLHSEPPPLAVLNYIWDNHSPVGTIVSNAYSNRVKMIVVESGNDHAGRWRLEQRSLLEDYKKAFGETPGKITGIAIMTDTDNTGESATAWYGDISLHKK